MTLLIACLMIYHYQLSPWLYFVAGGLFYGHIYLFKSSGEQDEKYFLALKGEQEEIKLKLFELEDLAKKTDGRLEALKSNLVSVNFPND